MYHIFFIHSSINRYLGCFYILAIVNKASMNIGVHISLNSSWCLNQSGKSEHPFLVSDLRGKSFSFSPLSIMSVGLSYVVFIMLRYIPSILTLRIFVIIVCWIFQMLFCIWDDHVIFNLHLMWYIIDRFWTLIHPCISVINPIWPCCMILLMCCGILFANILLRIFASVFIRETGLYFSFGILVWFWYQSNPGLIKWVWKSLSIFWNSLRRIGINYFFKCLMEFSSKVILSWTFAFCLGGFFIEYIWHITLCKLMVFSALIWYTYIW